MAAPSGMAEQALRTFQLVVAATRKLGIGKAGTMPWKLPGDMAYFKALTATSSDASKVSFSAPWSSNLYLTLVSQTWLV